MGKSLSSAKKPQTEITLEEVKVSIVKSIRRKYGMTVSEFAVSKHAKAILGKDISPSSVRAYLSSGSTSVPVIKKLCKHFNLGELSTVTTKITTTKYFLKQT